MGIAPAPGGGDFETVSCGVISWFSDVRFLEWWILPAPPLPVEYDIVDCENVFFDFVLTNFDYLFNFVPLLIVYRFYYKKLLECVCCYMDEWRLLCRIINLIVLSNNDLMYLYLIVLETKVIE